MSKVDIITTTYRSTEKLKRCIETVVERTKYVDYNWFIWCNDPNEEVKKIIHDALYLDNMLINDKIIPIFNDNNDGTFSSNNNEAAAEGDGEYILFLNDDVEPINENWLHQMTYILDTDPKVGAVGALLLYPNKTIQHCGVMFDYRTNGLPYHIQYKQPLTQFVQSPRYYQAVTGACLLVRREDFKKLNGLDESFRYGYEDVDYCLRLKQALGKLSVYCPGAQLIHYEGVSGAFKNHPYLQHNIKIFKDRWQGKIFNDHQFYLQNHNFMVYKVKQVVSTEDNEEQEIEE